MPLEALFASPPPGGVQPGDFTLLVRPGTANVYQGPVAGSGGSGLLLGALFDITNYGAVNNNAVTDCAASVVAALAAALASPTGGTVMIPAGRFRIGQTLSIALSGNQAVKLQGSGRDVSELVFSGDGDGLVVSFSGPSNWLRTVENPAPTFQIEGLSLVRSGAGISGKALRISGQTSGNGFSPRVKIQNFGIHGTINGAQGWHDGIDYRSMPSGLTIDDAYMVLANVAPPYGAVGDGIHIEGGSVVGGASTLISSLYYFTNITIQNARYGVSIGQGVQGVYMDRVGGNANIFIYASQPAANGDTATIALTNSNATGYLGSFYASNIDYIWLTNNQFQPFESSNYTAVEMHNGGLFLIDGNTFIGSLSHAGTWQAIYIDKPGDTVGSFNNRIISRNIISLFNVGVQLTAATKNTMMTGNAINNTASAYIINTDNVATNNLIDGVHEMFASANKSAMFNAPMLVNGAATIGGVLTVAGQSRIVLPGLRAMRPMPLRQRPGSS